MWNDVFHRVTQVVERSVVLNIGPIKWKLNALIYHITVIHSEGLSCWRFVCSWTIIEMSNTSVLLTQIVFYLIRDGLQRADISGAAYSQWCKKKQHQTSQCFLLMLFFPMWKTGNQCSSHMYSAHKQVTAATINTETSAKRVGKHVGKLLIILVSLRQD